MRISAQSIIAVVSSVLRVFQVHPPVITPDTVVQGALLQDDGGPGKPFVSRMAGCVVTQTLMTHSFANSYGKPYVGPYTPPECSFNRITLNLTVTAAGKQFDRLAVAYFGDIEIWRTSTAEPTPNGIIWTYVKDVSHLLSLFAQPQTLVFDLGNLVNEIYTSPFNVTLQATFFTTADLEKRADLIIPISAGRSASNKSNFRNYGLGRASNALVLPRNMERAVVTVSATGQMDEEFWYSNVPSSNVDTFGSDSLLGHSSFREIQLLIDGNLAGVVWPFPIIFTGGIVRGFWRPVVGIDAFDIREDEIDITPWLPLLCDGESHSFELRIVGIDDDGNGGGLLSEAVGSYWVLTGKMFVWLDSGGGITTGGHHMADVSVCSISMSSTVSTTSNGTNCSLSYTVNVDRQLYISSEVRTSHGTKVAAWQQYLAYSNEGDISSFGDVQVIAQNTSGRAISSEGYSRTFDYPLFVNSTVVQDKSAGTLSISAALRRAQVIEIGGRSVFPTGLESFDLPHPEDAGRLGSRQRFHGSRLTTSQNGSAVYFSHGNTSISPGTTQQHLSLYGLLSAALGSVPETSVEVYRRHVVAVNDTLVRNEEFFPGQYQKVG
ncbi:uncharacterized protein Z520_07409 [Fonsecaea multimorphosa CBS 102226]|uniref:Peptide N-acetyl-beta-D-glucosaminyl asparaginase amidase A N-terminal domain-containing protein n=1 Tax=Fonsecaea multimorphosa CBS 102226 TaxID=1442371 RepID=A0A0D2H4B5_9EURO|nr:uncharacterized protein Z520_07409 [Fonsecaea multimorphosa CBS 102226]KIX96690.1 hypothetical protein Z520_07409 [Fonsecaea multimorphosa CBS 102226]OAL22745.1 hypothetical protein AYO22_06927 [Fonsecaea multimorphosa]